MNFEHVGDGYQGFESTNPKDFELNQLESETTQQLNALKKNILGSDLFDDQEKTTLTLGVEKELFEQKLAEEKYKLGIEKSVNNEMGDLLADIQSEIMEAHEDNSSERRLFRSIYSPFEIDNYSESKNQNIARYEDMLNLVTINKYLENTGTFISKDLGDLDYIKQYNLGDYMASKYFDELHVTKPELFNRGIKGNKFNPDQYVSGYRSPEKNIPKNHPGESV